MVSAGLLGGTEEGLPVVDLAGDRRLHLLAAFIVLITLVGLLFHWVAEVAWTGRGTWAVFVLGMHPDIGDHELSLVIMVALRDSWDFIRFQLATDIFNDWFRERVSTR